MKIYEPKQISTFINALPSKQDFSQLHLLYIFMYKSILAIVYSFDENISL